MKLLEKKQMRYIIYMIYMINDISNEESVAKWLRHEPAELEIGGSNPPTLFFEKELLSEIYVIFRNSCILLNGNK